MRATDVVVLTYALPISIAGAFTTDDGGCAVGEAWVLRSRSNTWGWEWAPVFLLNLTTLCFRGSTSCTGAMQWIFARLLFVTQFMFHCKTCEIPLRVVFSCFTAIEFIPCGDNFRKSGFQKRKVHLFPVIQNFSLYFFPSSFVSDFHSRIFSFPNFVPVSSPGSLS